MNHLVILKRLPQLYQCIGSRLTVVVGGHCSHMSSSTDFKPSEELAKERYDLRSGEDIARKRARLLYQSRKRGMLENGVILASFADKYLNKLDEDHLDQYDRLINLPTNDWDIYYWATKTKPTPAEFETPVLEMLRQHLKSKVSSEEKLSQSVLGKSNLDDIVMPASKKSYDLEIDVQKVDLTNYENQLFDHRTRTYASRESILLMTPWRKKQLERRLRRAVSQPISLSALSTQSKKGADAVYTQSQEHGVTPSVLVPNDLIDSDYQRYMKHHDLLQHFLANPDLTDNPLEYDDEAEAWAAMLWHRNYGSDDDLVSPIKNRKCNACRTVLQCCDPGLKGYVPREIYVSIDTNTSLSHNSISCQQCKFSTVYDAKLTHELNPHDYNHFLRHIARDKKAIFIVLLDLTDFPGSVWKDMINFIDGWNKRLIIVGNKMDLLPYDGSKILERVKHCLKKNLSKLNNQGKNLFINDLTVISARTGFGIEELVGRIMNFSEEEPKNVYIVGSNNSGKSTLFSSLIQSDLCATREGDMIGRVSRYQLPRSQIKMLRFPIDLAEGWEIEMKKRRLERRERNTKQIEMSLKVLTERRRESMPHMSTLINRLAYLPAQDNGSLIRREKSEEPHKPNFAPDHPLANLKELNPMSATEERFKDHGFCYHTPSPINPDQLHDLLTNEERLEVFPNETIVPRKYSLRPLQTIFIAGLARLDLLTSQSNVIFIVFASKYLPIHVVQTRKADKFYNQFLGSPYLGVPFGDDARLAVWPELVNAQPDFHIISQGLKHGCADIVLSSAGWAVVNMIQDQECLVRAYTPEGRGIYLRDPPLLSKSHDLFLGKKIRDTPVFNNLNYKIQTCKLE